MQNSLHTNKTRNSSIELLRILAMFFVVLSHYSVHGQLNSSVLCMNFNKSILELTISGNLGVDIFIIISGFFLINSKFKLKKLIKLICQVLFYSIIIYVLFISIGLIKFDLFDFIRSLLPTTTKQYWFFTAYITLYLLHPFINVFLKNINKKQYLLFLSLIIFIWSIIPTFVFHYDFYGSEIAQFIMFYSIGAYIRLHPLNVKNEKVLSIILIVINLLMSIFIIFLEHKISFVKKINLDNSGRNSIFLIALAIGLFLFFKRLHVKDSKFVNGISKCTFGVYLIHDNSYVREWLWNDVFPNSSYANSKLLILHMIGSVFAIYFVCTVIEYFRIMTIEKPLFKLLDKPIDIAESKIKTVFDKIYNKIDKVII